MKLSKALAGIGRCQIVFVCGLTTALALTGGAVADQPPGYYATILPQLQPGGGFPCTVPTALNNSREVVGRASGSGFLWSEAQGAVRFVDLYGWAYSDAKSINDSGVCVGRFRTDNSHGTQAFTFTRESGPTPLPKLVDHELVNAQALEINNNGLVVGFSDIAPPDPYGETRSHAVMWRNGVISDLGTLGGDYAKASGVNNAETVVGGSNFTDYGAWSAFKWTEESGMQPLSGVQPDGFSYAYDINEGQFIAGSTGLDPDSGEFGQGAAIWSPDDEATLLPFWGEGSPYFPRIADAFALNDHNQVVGHEMVSAVGEPMPNAMLWQDGEVYRLQDFVLDLPEGLRLDSANDINDNGEIIVSAYDMNGPQIVAVLLTPIPEPATLSLLVLGALLLRRR